MKWWREPNLRNILLILAPLLISITAAHLTAPVCRAIIVNQSSTVWWLAGQINVTGRGYKHAQRRAITTHVRPAICPALLPWIGSAAAYTSDSIYSARPRRPFVAAEACLCPLEHQLCFQMRWGKPVCTCSTGYSGTKSRRSAHHHVPPLTAPTQQLQRHAGRDRCDSPKRLCIVVTEPTSKHAKGYWAMRIHGRAGSWNQSVSQTRLIWMKTGCGDERWCCYDNRQAERAAWLWYLQACGRRHPDGLGF